MSEELIPANATANAHTHSIVGLATQLSYDGDLSVGALEDGIRLFQKRTIEDLFELGKRLLLLKEQTPHGEFQNRVELLGFDPSLARKLMGATLKFAKQETSPVLKTVKSQSKLLELIALDDDDIKIINEGGSIGDISLDTIETMSVRELKKALRDAKADNDAKEQVIQTKDQKTNELLAENAKLKSPAQIKKRQESEAELLQKQAIQLMQKAVLTFLDAVSQFNIDMNAAVESCMDTFVVEQYEANIRMTYQSIAQRCNEAGLPIDFEQLVAPEWLLEAMNEDETQVAELQGSEA